MARKLRPPSDREPGLGEVRWLASRGRLVSRAGA
jgi:hypothetical protein